MPQLASPDMPAWAERVCTALGNRPAMAALVALASSTEPLSQPMISQQTGLNTEAVSAAVQRLEAAGLAVGSVPAPRPRGTRVTWVVNRDALATLVRDLDAGMATGIATRSLDRD